MIEFIVELSLELLSLELFIVELLIEFIFENESDLTLWKLNGVSYL